MVSSNSTNVNLVADIHVIDLDSWVQVNPASNHVNTVSLGSMSQGRVPTFYGHLDHVGWMCVHSGNKI